MSEIDTDIFHIIVRPKSLDYPGLRDYICYISLVYSLLFSEMPVWDRSNYIEGYTILAYLWP